MQTLGSWCCCSLGSVSMAVLSSRGPGQAAIVPRHGPQAQSPGTVPRHGPQPWSPGTVPRHSSLQCNPNPASAVQLFLLPQSPSAAEGSALLSYKILLT